MILEVINSVSLGTIHQGGQIGNFPRPEHHNCRASKDCDFDPMIHLEDGGKLTHPMWGSGTYIAKSMDGALMIYFDDKGSVYNFTGNLSSAQGWKPFIEPSSHSVEIPDQAGRNSFYADEAGWYPVEVLFRVPDSNPIPNTMTKRMVLKYSPDRPEMRRWNMHAHEGQILSVNVIGPMVMDDRGVVMIDNCQPLTGHH